MANRKPPKNTGVMVVEPSVRVYTTWSPTLIRAAELTADTGDMRMVADLCDWLLGDDRIPGVLRTRIQGLLGLDPTFEQSGDKRKSKRVVRALEAGEDWWEAYPETELAQLHTWGLLLGLAPARHNWTLNEEHGGRVLPMPAFWHPRHLRFSDQTREWRIRTQTKGGFGIGNEETLVPGDGTWILHTPNGPNRPWSTGLWRGLARLALLKWYAIGDYGRAGEAGARHVVTADKDVKSSKDQRQEIASDLSIMGRDGTIVLPPGFDYKLVELTAGTKEIYDAQIAMANTAIAVAIRGGNLTTEVTQGSFAATKTQAEFGDSVNLRFDAQALTTTVHDQSLVWWAEFNFGDRALAPWPVYPVEPKKDLKARAETLSTASTALDRFLSNGVPLDLALFAEEFEIDVKKTPDGEPAVGQTLFQYHLDYGILTVNEARVRMGLPPIPGGNERAIPSAALTAPAAAAPQPVKPNQAGTPPSEPNTPQNGEPMPMQPATAHASRHIHGAATTGADNGQQYTDDVAASVAEHGAAELAETVAAMVAAVRNAGSYADAKAAILEKYRGLASPARLASLTEAAITMSQMAGHLSVRQDIPELKEKT